MSVKEGVFGRYVTSGLVKTEQATIIQMHSI
jgi:hypothetical protein